MLGDTHICLHVTQSDAHGVGIVDQMPCTSLSITIGTATLLGDLHLVGNWSDLKILVFIWVWKCLIMLKNLK